MHVHAKCPNSRYYCLPGVPEPLPEASNAMTSPDSDSQSDTPASTPCSDEGQRLWKYYQKWSAQEDPPRENPSHGASEEVTSCAGVEHSGNKDKLMTAVDLTGNSSKLYGRGCGVTSTTSSHTHSSSECAVAKPTLSLSYRSERVS